MTDHKFTDDELIKLLNQCHDTESMVAFVIDSSRFISEVVTLQRLIDILNRQKAEIERLDKEVDRLSQCVLYHDGIVSDLEKDVLNAKSEAIKEFAERLIEKCDAPHWCVWMSEIQDLMEEMTEGHDESQNT